MNNEIYVSTMLEQMSFILNDITLNASLYSREELENFQNIAEQISQTVKINIDNENYFDC